MTRKATTSAVKVGTGKGGGGHGKSIASFFEAHAPAPPDGTAVQEKRRRTGDQRESQAASLQDPVIVIQDSCETPSQTGADGKSAARSFGGGSFPRSEVHVSDSGCHVHVAGAGSKAATHRAPSRATEGNFGALITHRIEDGKPPLKPLEWWGRSFSVAYRNLFQDRRPPGVGIHGENWGRRVQLELPGFRAQVFGGGRPADVLRIPTAGPCSTPQVDHRHWRNLRFMMQTLGFDADAESITSADKDLFDAADHRVFQRLQTLPESAQSLFATLRNAAHPACGGLPARSCRWFPCDSEAVRTAAQALCDAGLASRLRSLRQVDDVCSLLPLLTDAQLKKVLLERLGGSSKLLTREALIAALVHAAKKPSVGQQCLSFKRVEASSGGGSRSTGGKKEQTFLAGPRDTVLPRAVLEMILGGEAAQRASSMPSHSRVGGTGRQDSLWYINLDEEAEAACQRLQLLFFSLRGFSPDDSAALLLCDLERLARGMGWCRSESAAADATGDDDNNEPAGSGLIASEMQLLHDSKVSANSEEAHDGRMEGGDSGLERTNPEDCVVPSKFVLDANVLPSRERFRDFESAVACSDALEFAVRCGDHKTAYDLVEKAAAALVLCDDEEDLSRVQLACFWSRVVFCGIGLLERDKQYRKALRFIDILLANPRPPVFSSPAVLRGQLLVRKAVDLQHAGANEQCLRACEQALQDKMVTGEYRIALETRCLRLAVPPLRWKKPVFQRRLVAPVRNVSSDHPSVECGAMECYMSQGWSHGVHTENGLWLTLFGILMADIILEPHAGEQPVLSVMEAPIDMRHSTFFQRRRHLFLPRLRALAGDNTDMLEEEAGAEVPGRGAWWSPEMQELESAGDVNGILARNWSRFSGLPCMGVDWQRFTLADLQGIVSCICGKVLARLFRCLAQDYCMWGHGLPDLFLWQPSAGRALLVEVKGPGDSLSHAQSAWIHELLEAGAAIELCHVQRLQ